MTAAKRRSPEATMEESAEFCCPGLSVLGAKVKDNDRLYLSLFKASDERVITAMTASDKAMQTALAVVKEASTEAKKATEKRFDEVSEKLDLLGKSLSAQITTATANTAGAAGRSGGINALWGYIAGAVGVASLIVGMILAFAR